MNDLHEISRIILSFDSMSHKKLQKILYYIYAWHWVILKKPIAIGFFEAWKHGPVCPQVYQVYKKYGWKNIPKKEYYSMSISNKQYKFIETIFHIYNRYEANEIEEISHEETPWINARNGLPNGSYCNNNISIDDIIYYYPKNNKEIYELLSKRFS